MPRGTQRRLVAVCDSIRSLYNVGSIFRTADAFGVEHLYLTGLTGAPDNELNCERIRKTALGAEQTVPWTKVDNLNATIERLKTEGFLVVALEQTPDAISLFDLRIGEYTTQSSIVQGLVIHDRVALVVGHELYGVSEPVLAAADVHVQIPMLGQKESLNVASAAAVALAWLRYSPTDRT